MERFSGAIIQSFTVYFDFAINVQHGTVSQGIPVEFCTQYQLVPLSWYRVRHCTHGFTRENLGQNTFQGIAACRWTQG